MPDLHVIEHPSGQFAALTNRVVHAIYPPIGTFEITAWTTPEPVPFSRRTSGKEKTLRAGERWAEQLFDCAWFRFRATVPSDHSASPALLVARIDINGEACIVDSQGTPLRGLTCVHSVFDRSLGTPGKTIFKVPPEFVHHGVCELWADAGLNDLFGSVPRQGRIEFAQLCLCREDLRALHYDLEVITELHQLLPADDALAVEIAVTLAEVDAALIQLTPDMVRSARRTIEPLLRHGADASALQVSAIGHAHLDLAWLWPIRETIRKGARTFATALYNLDQYPEYVFGMSQPQLFAWMQAHYPALYGKIKSAVHSGRIELLGSMWVEPDCNLPSGESLVRQILHGAAYFQAEFGYDPRFCWQPDVFGYNAQLPQILKKSGHDFFMTQKLSWNLVNKFPHHSFVWEGLDGSTVLAHMLPEETYNGPAAPRSLAKIACNYAQRDGSRHALMVYGIGDGGGGPDAEHLERLRRERSLASLPSARPRRADDFFADWAQDAANFPRWRGELYLERHQGTFTTQALAKKYNRQAEISLREVELALVLCTQFDAEAGLAQGHLDGIWKEILLYQFHDILPGSSIKRVYDEAYPRYRALLAELEAMASGLWTSLAARIATSADYVVFNSLPGLRSEWLNIGGRWCFVNIPGAGWAPVAARKDLDPLPSNVSFSANVLENDRLSVRFSDAGEIISIQSKGSGREFVPAGEALNLFSVYDDKGDAWDFPPDYRATPSRPLTLISATPFRDGPRAGVIQLRKLGASTLQQRISLCAGSAQLEFETEVYWQEAETMLRVRFPVEVESDTARFEVPYGSVQRSTRDVSSWEKAQIEVPAHQWVDLSASSHGVALLNDCKYGFRVKGGSIEMNVLRSVPHPGTPLINKDDHSDRARATHYTDQGAHSFRYAIWPHEGFATEGDLTAAARRFNIPLRVVQRPASHHPTLPESVSVIHLDSTAIDLAAVKPAERGSGYVLRLANVENRAITASIRPQIVPNSALLCDLREIEQASLSLRPDGSFDLRFTPFEVKTVWLR
jgi:alpha-mannosidase